MRILNSVAREDVDMLDIAITGAGVVSALGCSTGKFHQAMMAGETAIHEAPWHNGEKGGRAGERSCAISIQETGWVRGRKRAERLDCRDEDVTRTDAAG